MMRVRAVFIFLFLAGLFWPVGSLHAQARMLDEQPQVLPIHETPVVIVTTGGTRHTFETEVAATSEQQAIGMMFRDSYPDDRGMLFPFERLRIASFWMKNCLIPLDMVFVRRNGTIANIEAMAEPGTLDGRRSKGHVIAVFEVRGGRMKELGIKAGDRLYHPTLGLELPAGTTP